MPNLNNKLIIGLLTLILPVLTAEAEFFCRGEILYKWKAKTNTTTSSSGQHNQAVKETPQPEAELNVFWTNIEQKAATAEEGKAKVEKIALTERTLAERACLSAHENQSGCIASKFASLSYSVSTLSFSAKKAIEDAIKDDCDKQQGKCLGSVVSEIKCSEIQTEAKATEPPSKDSKGKKK